MRLTIFLQGLMFVLCPVSLYCVYALLWLQHVAIKHQEWISQVQNYLCDAYHDEIWNMADVNDMFDRFKRDNHARSPIYWIRHWKDVYGLPRKVAIESFPAIRVTAYSNLTSNN